MAIDWDAVISAADKAAAWAARARETERAQARQYLAATDWYVIRAADTGEPMPAPVRARRIAARQVLSEGRSPQD